ncbi:hypothetical protein ACF3NF_06525 [Anaerococcus martiniensis]|uniref:hypothetical protein n=1 Tax=Anaerococcus sp. WGS1579 TaxID=3366809 RepID=UPI00372CE9D4
MKKSNKVGLVIVLSLGLSYLLFSNENFVKQNYKTSEETSVNINEFAVKEKIMHGASIDIDRLAFRKTIIDKNKSNKRSLFVDSNVGYNYETSLNINQENELEDKNSPVLVENLFTENNMPTVSSTKPENIENNLTISNDNPRENDKLTVSNENLTESEKLIIKNDNKIEYLYQLDNNDFEDNKIDGNYPILINEINLHQNPSANTNEGKIIETKVNNSIVENKEIRNSLIEKSNSNIIEKIKDTNIKNSKSIEEITPNNLEKKIVEDEFNKKNNSNNLENNKNKDAKKKENSKYGPKEDKIKKNELKELRKQHDDLILNSDITINENEFKASLNKLDNDLD